MQEKMSDARWISVDEITDHFGIGKGIIFIWIAKRDFPVKRVGKFWEFIAAVDVLAHSGLAA